jgi:hypothetical protein
MGTSSLRSITLRLANLMMRAVGADDAEKYSCLDQLTNRRTFQKTTFSDDR